MRCFAGLLRGRKSLGFRIDFCLLEQTVGGMRNADFAPSIESHWMQRPPSEIRDRDVTVYFPFLADGIPANRLGRCTALKYSSFSVQHVLEYNTRTVRHSNHSQFLTLSDVSYCTGNCLRQEVTEKRD